MQSITKFKAIDGKEFNNENECLNYENLIKRVNEIMNVLPQLPNEENCNFLNGDGFIQHDKKILQKVRIELLEEIKQHIKHKWVQQTIDDENAHPSYVGRLIDEYQINPLSKAWHRFMCIDKLGREWGQPYFASNPGKGKQINDKIDENNDGKPDCKFPPTYNKVIPAWKCGTPSLQKVFVCFKTNTGGTMTICTPYAAVNTHIAAGNRLGICGSAKCGGGQ